MSHEPLGQVLMNHEENKLAFEQLVRAVSTLQNYLEHLMTTAIR